MTDKLDIVTNPTIFVNFAKIKPFKIELTYIKIQKMINAPNESTSTIFDKHDEELYDEVTIVADPGQQPIRLDKFLMDKLERVTRNRVQNGIKEGIIRVNEKKIKSNYKVRPNDVINVLMPRAKSEEGGVKAQNIPLDIVYEDDDILLVNKPPKMCVHPSFGHPDRTLVNALRYYFQDKELPILDGNQEDRAGIVHRIDKNTSGLLIVAKNEHAISHLAKQFFDHTIERKYQALIWGEFEEDGGTIKGHVGRNPRNRKEMTVFPEGEQGKHATTHFKVLERMYYVSLVECQLETGRTHQIRVHMKYKGHPLFSDEKYGGSRIRKGTVFSKYKRFVDDCFITIPRHALHAKSLGFEHPRTGERMHFEIDLPEDFQQVLNMWRKYLTHRKKLVGK